MARILDIGGKFQFAKNGFYQEMLRQNRSLKGCFER